MATKVESKYFVLCAGIILSFYPLYQIKAINGFNGEKIYDRRAWTGGNPPPEVFPRLSDEINLVQAFYQEQIEIVPDANEETKQIFMNRARYDAFATLEAEIEKNKPKYRDVIRLGEFQDKKSEQARKKILACDCGRTAKMIDDLNQELANVTNPDEAREILFNYLQEIEAETK